MFTDFSFPLNGSSLPVSVIICDFFLKTGCLNLMMLPDCALCFPQFLSSQRIQSRDWVASERSIELLSLSKSMLGGSRWATRADSSALTVTRMRFLHSYDLLAFRFFPPRLHLSYVLGGDYKLAAIYTVPLLCLGGTHILSLVFEILSMLT